MRRCRGGAVGRRSRGLRAWSGAALAAALALTAWPAGAAAAAGDLKATPAEVRRALFVAGDVDRLSTARGEQDVVLERLLQRMYALQPALPARTAAPRVRRLAAALPTRLPSPAALGSQGPN